MIVSRLCLSGNLLKIPLRTKNIFDYLIDPVMKFTDLNVKAVPVLECPLARCKNCVADKLFGYTLFVGRGFYKVICIDRSLYASDAVSQHAGSISSDR